MDFDKNKPFIAVRKHDGKEFVTQSIREVIKGYENVVLAENKPGDYIVIWFNDKGETSSGKFILENISESKENKS